MRRPELSAARARTIAGLNLRLLLTDVAGLLILVAMPLVMMAFLQPLGRTQLGQRGFTGATGAEQTVPGMAVLFSFYLVMYLGMAFFREHEWGTWDRLRASAAHPAEIIAGKCTPTLLVGGAQLGLLWLAGLALFGLRVRGSAAGVVAVSLALMLATIGIGIALVAVCRTLEQMNVFANLGAIVLGGLGGAFVSPDALPGWARAAAPFTPQHWAITGYERVVLRGGGVSSVALPCAVLLAFGAAGAAVATLRFRMADVKVGVS
jgi:ABC-2 type transport system permease protein